MESKENKEQIEEKFQAKLQGLLEMAKKKKMVIEDTEIIRYFNDCLLYTSCRFDSCDI